MCARRVWTLLWALVLALACTGCSDDVQRITAWTRVAPGAPPVAITVPGDLRSDGEAPGARTVLETIVHVAPEWRDKPLTLAITELEGDVALSANGRSLPDRKVGFAHDWRIDDVAGGSPELHLRLELAPATWPKLFTAPRLSATPDGDDWFRFVRASAFHASYVVTSIVGFLFLLYFGLFLLDRQRTAHGWFALQAAAALPITSRVLVDVPRLFGGAVDLQVQIVAGALGFVAAAFFTSAYFRKRAPPRAVWALLALGVPYSFIRTTPVLALYTHVSIGILLGGVVWVTSILVRIGGTRADQSSAWTLAIGWAVFMLLAGPDVVASAGVGDVSGGFRGSVIGMGTFASLQATILLRDHVRSLRAGEARAALLEAQSKEVSLLNVELRRQIADRSRQLAEALARIGKVPSQPIAFEPGDVVHARYRIIRALGQGGMGAVYEVARLADEKRFALKVLTSATTGVALARLAREAQIAAKLSHERLVSIADVDVSEAGSLYIVMELVEGAPLVDLRARYGDVAWALPLLRQMAVGLAVLHHERIVHRDLKPANVLVARPDDSDDPGVKIADFGIARLADDAAIDPNADTAAFAGDSATNDALTERGILLGTPMYMAPELARGARDARPSSDIWAFGVIAYELLAGALPFAVPPALAAVVRQPWPTAPRLDDARYGATVSALVARCLGAAPESRPTAEECAATLRSSPSAPASPPSPE